MELNTIKQRFEIIGNSPLLNIAIENASKVAPTDITVLINGESGVGKEAFSKIIHLLSNRKHGPFIAVNCGAIPEGTIDSELFGHEKGAFTGAHDTRKGYFETVNGGTIFLDEVGELPLETQARLLRVLESGEFIKVGSSKALKTDVRVVAATNKDLFELIAKGKFREDLYYRLSTVPIKVPPLRERKGDIYLLFRKFSDQIADKYRNGMVELDKDAIKALEDYSWPGNIRQLRNIVEQVSVLESGNVLDAYTLKKYLPEKNRALVPTSNTGEDGNSFSERDIFYKILFDMRKDVSDLKKVVLALLQNNNSREVVSQNREEVNNLFHFTEPVSSPQNNTVNFQPTPANMEEEKEEFVEATEEDKGEEKLSLIENEKEMIMKALTKYKGRRKKAAQELGISERTLYRKIKEFEL